MPLNQNDKNQLYSQAFAANAKAMLGESAFTALDLKTTLDVTNMEMGVLRDELKAAQDETEKLAAERDNLVAQLAGTTEGRDAALQALADARAKVPAPGKGRSR